ncbi:Serine/threonine-protein kinase ppk4, partial [Nibea albiflora]
MAKETLDTRCKAAYKSSTDIQVAGMLIYYILSGGHHPFGDKSYKCESNIHEGIYTLDHVQDVVAKDLIERMIDAEPKNRPKVEECLSHPFFWTTDRILEYLKGVGNREEVENCGNADQKLISSLKECGGDESFKQWKKEFSTELVKRLEKKRKSPYPDNMLGLLRFIRNFYAQEDVMKELISAGAQIMLFPVNDREQITHNEKLSQMVHNLASKGDELCLKVKYFLDMDIAVRVKSPEEVFKTFDSHMMREHPQAHLTMIEVLFN